MGLAMALVLSLASPVAAQNSRDAERRLEKVQRELNEVAAERRRIEGQRGEATRQLREADEQVGRSSRGLRSVEQRIASEQASLAQLQAQRQQMEARLGAQREELARLLRAAYQQGEDAPLKVMLAQDRVADSGRLLTYHRYLQADRAQRIATLTADLENLSAVEREIAARQEALQSTRADQRRQLNQLESDRKTRARLVSKLDTRYQDSSTRERELGRDAEGLQQLLKRLRDTAARAEAQRKAAAAKIERQPAGAGKATAPRAPAVVAAAPQVGGLGWPLSGSLLAGYGARLPDGRGSEGLLIAAPAGAPVKAVADGQVVYAEWMTGYGLLLIVDHGNGYMSLYAHNDALLKDVGDAVRRGDTVSTVGSSGGSGRPALYFELRRNGQPVNPGTWLRR
ncbi:peptidoglycan DD-metalloendopeptidase family protein [Lysobacter niastensis]|uniref:Peptidoglycan DD-metalloendopeptidase family protein n=2 Tax=Lysobacter niastensis TaxID=380629 RepID=A0ABS0BBW2_9GAMM|nr:peptidoglycan DD-metalloendopeptidase family protein [Lysobacter niastensis]